MNRRPVSLPWGSIGDDASERLRKLLDAFAYGDVSRLTPRDRVRVTGYLMQLVEAVTARSPVVAAAGRGPVELKLEGASRQVLRRAQRAVRGAAETLAAGKPYGRSLRDAGIGAARLRDGELRVVIFGDLADVLAYAAMRLLAGVRPSLVRRCPYRAGRRPECGRVFVGYKRQKWCRDHTDAARRDRDRRAQVAHRERVRKAQARRRAARRRRKP